MMLEADGLACYRTCYSNPNDARPLACTPPFTGVMSPMHLRVYEDFARIPRTPPPAPPVPASGVPGVRPYGAGPDGSVGPGGPGEGGKGLEGPNPAAVAAANASFLEKYLLWQGQVGWGEAFVEALCCVACDGAGREGSADRLVGRHIHIILIEDLIHAH